MEPVYFGSFKQWRWLSIFLVHEIQLRPRYIMESANGSLIASLFIHCFGCRSTCVIKGNIFFVQVCLRTKRKGSREKERKEGSTGLFVKKETKKSSNLCERPVFDFS